MDSATPTVVSRTLLPARACEWAGDAIAITIIVAAGFLPLPIPEMRPTGALGLLVVLAPALLVLVRRRFPLATLGAAVVLYAAASLLGTTAPGGMLAVAICMFGVSNRTDRATSLRVGVGASAAMMLATMPASGWTLLDLGIYQAGITTAFAAAFGDGVRSWREQLAAITERAETAERTREAEARQRVSEERLRIARDLHDAVAHQIAVISLNAGVANSSLGRDEDATRESLQIIRAASKTVLAEIGSLMTMLRAEDEDEAAPAPLPGLGQLDDLLGTFREAGLAVDVRIEGTLDRVAGAVDTVAYRIIQEALTNAHKHGAEHRAHVLITVADMTLTVVVTNPVRPRTQDVAGGSQLGLIGLRERVAAIGGQISATPALAGWRLSATLPLTQQEDQ